MGRPIRNRTKHDQPSPTLVNKMIWHIAVYIRLSKEDTIEEGEEDKDASDSVVNQEKILTDYVHSYFDGEYRIIDYYIDDGISGTNASRANFMRMVNDIENGKVNCVICKTLARAFRNYSDQGYYLEYFFPKMNARFISTGDPYIDTFKNPEAINGLEVPITGLMNDRFAQRTSNDVRRTFNMKRLRGEYIGAFGPYGYIKDPNDKSKLLIDPEAAANKKEMRRWIISEGMSLTGVAFRLNEMGILNPTMYKRSKGMKYYNPHGEKNDGLWTGTVVKQVLVDMMNLGHMVQGKHRVVSYKVRDKVRVPKDEWCIVENTHEPIFTQEEYDELMSVLQRDTRTPNKSSKVHMFAGFLKCFDCNAGMQRNKIRKYVYYHCRTYKSKSKILCTKHTITNDLLSEAVLLTIQTQIKLVGHLAEVIEEVNSQPVVNTFSSRLDTLIQSRISEREKYRDASDDLYLDWKTGKITEDEYTRLKERFRKQMNHVDGIIANLEKEISMIGFGITKENPLFTHFLKHRNISKLDRGVLVSLVDNIFVHEDKEITVTASR